MTFAAGTRTTTDPNPSPVSVTILAGSQPTVHPELATLHLGGDEELVWECKNNTGQKRPFKVIFKGESPFHDRIFTDANPHSGRARPDVKPDKTRSYPYTVILAEGVVDPQVIVDY